MKIKMTIILLLVAIAMTNCKKKKTTEPTTDNPVPQTTTPITEGYLMFTGGTYYSNLAGPGTTNYTAKQLFWENNNGTKTNYAPDSVSLNNFWLVGFSTGQPVDMRTWGPTSVPPFDPFGSMTWYTKATTNVPAINQTISGMAYLDLSYFPTDQNTSDPEISLSKVSGFSFIHAPIPASYTKYSLITSLSGVPNSTRKIEKTVNGNSGGVAFSNSEMTSLFSSPSYTAGSIWIEAYNESVVSPSSSKSFTIISISSINTQVKFY